MPSLARSVPKPLKVPSLARSVPKPLKVPSLARSVRKPLKVGQEGGEGEGATRLSYSSATRLSYSSAPASFPRASWPTPYLLECASAASLVVGCEVTRYDSSKLIVGYEVTRYDSPKLIVK